jgi:hypothetical protein
MEASDQLHALVALSQGKKRTVSLGYEAGWAIEAQKI